jgi:hypothetical protein
MNSARREPQGPATGSKINFIINDGAKRLLNFSHFFLSVSQIGLSYFKIGDTNKMI